MDANHESSETILIGDHHHLTGIERTLARQQEHLAKTTHFLTQ